MRELPEPDVKDAMWNMTPISYSPELVLAIQKQAYEDGLRDAAAHARSFLTSGRSPLGPSVESAILAMLTASQKEQQ